LLFAIIVPFSLAGRALFFKELWHLPSWSAPLKSNEPLISFDFGAWLFLACGIGLLPILLRNRDLWWMPAFAFSASLGTFVGLEISKRFFASRIVTRSAPQPML
jgi:hypothetical protein